MRELVIDRRIWLHGEKNGDVYLLRPTDQKMCCLGIYARACGLSDAELLARRYPSSVDVRLPKEAAWMLDEKVSAHFGITYLSDSDDATSLAVTNDATDISQEEREKRIAELFALYDVRVTFVGERVPKEHET